MSEGYECSIHLSDWHNIFQYISAYGAYVALWAVLSAVTFYRREISCNRSYHTDDDEGSYNSGPQRDKILRDDSSVYSYGDEKELMAEQLLEGAGLYCSSRPIMHLLALFWLGSDGSDTDKKTTEHSSPEDLLESAGKYVSLEPILAAIAFLMIWKKAERAKGLKPLSSSLSSFSSSSFPNQNYGCDPLDKGLPSDVHVQIASFLHPRDVVTLACVSKAYHNITHDSKSMTASAIWKTLWHRDFAWIVLKWKIGKLALKRSNCKQWNYSKEFYFLFAQSYLDYVLAGHNTLDSCLVGIHSNIYNITPFLFSHPGSPDTLMVHSGRDATNFFNDMGHSLGARKLAMGMCVVVNRSAQSDNDKCGLFPTNHTVVDEDEQYPLPMRLPDGEDNLLKTNRRGATMRTGNGGGTLYEIRRRYLEEREQIRARNTSIYANDPDVLGQVNTYFDPFTMEWRIWYTDTDLQTIFLPTS